MSLIGPSINICAEQRGGCGVLTVSPYATRNITQNVFKHPQLSYVKKKKGGRKLRTKLEGLKIQLKFILIVKKMILLGYCGGSLGE